MRCLAFFKRIDKANTGFVDKKEAKKWFDSLFPEDEPDEGPDPDDPLEKIFSKIDTDKDQRVSLKDWNAYWEKRLSKNFQKSGELKMSTEDLDGFLETIRNGHGAF